MLTGISHHPGGKTRMTKKWDTLAILVNAVDPESAKKSGEKWKSVSYLPYAFSQSNLQWT